MNIKESCFEGRWEGQDHKERSDFNWGAKWFFGHIQVRCLKIFIGEVLMLTVHCWPHHHHLDHHQQPQPACLLGQSWTQDYDSLRHANWILVVFHTACWFRCRLLKAIFTNLWISWGDNCQPGDQSFNDGDTHQGTVDKVLKACFGFGDRCYQVMNIPGGDRWLFWRRQLHQVRDCGEPWTRGGAASKWLEVCSTWGWSWTLDHEYDFHDDHLFHCNLTVLCP